MLILATIRKKWRLKGGTILIIIWAQDCTSTGGFSLIFIIKPNVKVNFGFDDFEMLGTHARTKRPWL